MLHDEIAAMEDPVEDVFVSNTATAAGNARLFEGTWVDNDHHVQSCLAGLLTIERHWACYATCCANALLRLSDEVAARAGLERFASAETAPRRPVTVAAASFGPASSHVRFTDADLAVIGVDRDYLLPFVLQVEHASRISGEHLGHTSLERRPLVCRRGETIVALPTALGAAARRFILEVALEADGCAALQDGVTSLQFGELFSLGRVGWKIRGGEPRFFGTTVGAMDFVGTFDEGGHVHVVFVPDDLAASAQGLRAMRRDDPSIGRRIEEVSDEVSATPSHRCGLTIVVLGGVGRGAWVDMGAPRAGWRGIMLGLPDFMRLASDEDLTALRAWKLLEQRAALAELGIVIAGGDDFLALYAYAKARSFELVGPEVTEGLVWLTDDWLADLRCDHRRSTDRHLVPSPRGGFAEVQRDGQKTFFREDGSDFVCLARMQEGALSGCVETPSRAWWIECEDRPSSDRGIAIVDQVWRMAWHWLAVVAPAVELMLPVYGAQALAFMLTFPSVDEPAAPLAPVGALAVPDIAIVDGRVVIECPAAYISTFARAENEGDAAMARALYEGACMLLGIAVPARDGLRERVRALTNGDQARFFHAVPARTIADRVFASTVARLPRLVAPEDENWSCLGLARRAGWLGAAGEVPVEEAGALLKRAVVEARDRIEATLKGLDRASVIETTLAKHAAVGRERATWRLTAGALMALYADGDDVVRAFNEREGERAQTGLCCRVVAEMALCMSPVGGPSCATADLDRLLGEASILLRCAGQSDAIYHGLSRSPLLVHPNGSFGFDTSFVVDTQRPYLEAHGSRSFRAAAAAYGDAFATPEGAAAIDAGFEAAFEAEFGCGPSTYYAFVYTCGDMAASRGKVQFRSTRKDVLEMMREAGIERPEFTYERFALIPRRRWDDPRPKDAKPSDWWPWRFNRRLSLVRRPIVQLDATADPKVLLAPQLIEMGLRHLCEAAVGRLPGELFESDAMRSWIGTVVDREGHAFNKAVAAALADLGWTTRTEVKMTMLGGDASLGDIDVLAWHVSSGLVHAIECKRLMFARTIGEIGERLTEYGTLAAEGERTPIQKHVDRLTFLRANKATLAKLIEIEIESLLLGSALVTDYLVPMRFSERARAMVDVIADVGSLEESFAIVDSPSFDIGRGRPFAR